MSRNRAGQMRRMEEMHARKHNLRAPLLLFIVILFAVLIAGGGIFYVQNKAYISQSFQKASSPPFSADHLLIKVLLKEGEFAEEQFRIMNIVDREQQITLSYDGLEGFVSVDSPEFSLMPGQTKVVKVSFRSADKEKGIEQQPGVYIGNLAVKSGEYSQEIPLIAEIESANVLFDTNLNPVSLDRKIEQGKDFVVEVRLFNLQSIDAENVEMRYVVKDLHGNTLITEQETAVVKTQASFFKTISLPKNLPPGSYVFGAETRLGNSVGTSSYIFEVVDPNERSGAPGFLAFCRRDSLCSGLSIAVVVLLLAIALYFYFFLWAFLYVKVAKTFPRREQERKGKGWFAAWMESRDRKRLERKEQKLRETERKRDEEEKRRLKELEIERELRRLEQERMWEKERIRKEREEHRVQLGVRLVKDAKIAIFGRKLSEEERERKEKEAEKMRLEREKLALQKRKQRIEMLRLLVFGKKEKGTGGARTITTVSKKRMSGMDTLIGLATDGLNRGDFKKARRDYEAIIRKYHSFSMEDKKKVYNSIISLYQKLVKEENKFHQHQKEGQERREAERKNLDEEKRRQHEEITAQKEGLLRKQKEEREKQEAERRKLEGEKERRREEAQRQREELQEQKKARREEARQQKRDEERKKAREGKQQAIAHHTKSMGHAEQEKLEILSRLSSSWEEFRVLLAKIESHEALLSRKESELDDSGHLPGQDGGGKSGQKHPSKAQGKRKKIAKGLASGKKAAERMHSRAEKMRKAITELQQRRIAVENEIFMLRRKIAGAKGGLGTIYSLFMPSTYSPSKDDLLMQPAIIPEKMPEEHAIGPQSIARQMDREAFGEGTDAGDAGAGGEQEIGEERDTSKRGPRFRKYARAVERAKERLAAGDGSGARKEYARARELYLKLEYHERKEVYEELNELYSSLAKRG
ncbi:TPA: hypothetical protein HA280_04105 [Candidatus Woesearchaeota archaeon]|nr:hypothetical protein [Candidatus Woesearchaeota archaeon]